MQPVRHGRGLRLLSPGRLVRLPRPQPVTHEKWYWLEWGSRAFQLHWRPRVGLYATSASSLRGDDMRYSPLAPCNGGFSVKRLHPVTGTDVIRPALSSESKLLGKVPQLCAFLTHTAYEDGTPRVPGGLWMENKGVVLEVVLRNPDSGARLPLVAPTLDEVLMLAEAALRADSAPWQPDRWLMEQLTKRSKKK